MKKLLLLSAMLLTTAISYGQCDQAVVLKSSKTEYVNRSGVVERSVDEYSTVEITKTQVFITPGSGDPMNGTIKSVSSCQWTTPYQEGKSVLKADFTNPEGGIMHGTMTIEGMGGKLSFTMEVEEIPDLKIRISLISFMEKK